MSFSDGKILINNVPADDKGKPNTLTREVAGDKLTQVHVYNGTGFSILRRLYVKKISLLYCNVVPQFFLENDFANSKPFDMKL